MYLQNINIETFSFYNTFLVTFQLYFLAYFVCMRFYYLNTLRGVLYVTQLFINAINRILINIQHFYFTC